MKTDLRLLGPIGFAFALLLAGCQTTAKFELLDVGQTLTGEPCEARALDGSGGYAIYCEGWRSASGRLAVSETLLALSDFATQSPWRADLDAVARCSQPREDVGLAGTNTLVLDCSLISGGWPYIAFVQNIDGRIFAAQGVPTTVPVLARAINIVSGQGSGASVQAAPTILAETRRIEARVGQGGSLASIKDIGAAQSLTLLGYRYSEGREWKNATDAHKRALAIKKNALGPDHPSVGPMISSIAQQLSVQGQLKLADDMFAEADPLMSSSDVVPYLSGRAVHEANKGNIDTAIELMRQAERASSGSGLSDVATRQNLLPEIDFQIRLGLVADAKANATLAVDQLERALGPANYWVAEAKQRLALTQQAEGRYQEAVQTWGDILELRELLFGDGPAVAITHRDLAFAHYQQRNLDQSLVHYEKSLHMLGAREESRSRMRLDDLGSATLVALEIAHRDPARASEIYNFLFELSQLPAGNTASKAIDQMAARLATDDRRVGDLARDLQEVQAARAQLGEALSIRFASGLDQSPSGDCRRNGRLSDCTEDQLRELISRADERYADLELALQSAHPQYAGLVAARPVSAADLTGVMRPDEALVHIVSTSWNTLVFVVRNGVVRLHVANISQDGLRDSVDELRQGLDWDRHGIQDFDVAAANRVYRILLGPVEREIETARHLIVVGTGPILSLPTGVLVTEQLPSGPVDYRDVAWLAKRHAISLLPTVRSFFDLRATAQPSRATQPFIGFADPAFDGQAGNVRAVDEVAAACRDENALPEVVRSLPRLPETVDELTAIASSLGAGPGSVIRGLDATEERVRQTDFSQFRVVAFATHGLLPGELACQAEPALAFMPSNLGEDDGLLDASEILSLDLDADWVLLSACNTAGSSGKPGGESLSGLAQAFFFAGARSLLVSHWAVASEPTTELTSTTFDRFGRDPTLTKAEALRLSQVAMIADVDLAHPFFWAPFSLVGDGGNLAFREAQG